MKNKKITLFVLGWSLEGTNFKLAESFIDTPPKNATHIRFQGVNE